MVDVFRGAVGASEDGAVGHIGDGGQPSTAPYDVTSLRDFPTVEVGSKPDMPQVDAATQHVFPTPDLRLLQPAHRQDMARKTRVAPDVSILKNGVVVNKGQWYEVPSMLGLVQSSAYRSLVIQYKSNELAPGLQLDFLNHETGDKITSNDGTVYQKNLPVQFRGSCLGWTSVCD